MKAKIHKIIIFSLLITSILALVVVSLTIRYSDLDETFLFETDLDINISDTVTYNGSLFDSPKHIYKIAFTNIKAKLDPLLEISVKVIINENYTDAVKGPIGTTYYNEEYAGKIDELSFTTAGLAVTCHVVISALVDMNPVYISLATASCILALYYFSMNLVWIKVEKSKIIEQIDPELPE